MNDGTQLLNHTYIVCMNIHNHTHTFEAYTHTQIHPYTCTTISIHTRIHLRDLIDKIHTPLYFHETQLQTHLHKNTIHLHINTYTKIHLHKYTYTHEMRKVTLQQWKTYIGIWLSKRLASLSINVRPIEDIPWNPLSTIINTVMIQGISGGQNVLEARVSRRDSAMFFFPFGRTGPSASFCSAAHPRENSRRKFSKDSYSCPRRRRLSAIIYTPWNPPGIVGFKGEGVSWIRGLNYAERRKCLRLRQKL